MQARRMVVLRPAGSAKSHPIAMATLTILETEDPISTKIGTTANDIDTIMMTDVKRSIEIGTGIGTETTAIAIGAAGIATSLTVTATEARIVIEMSDGQGEVMVMITPREMSATWTTEKMTTSAGKVIAQRNTMNVM